MTQQKHNIHVVTERPEHFEEMGWTIFAPAVDVLLKLQEVEEFEYDCETTGLGSFMFEDINCYQIGLPGIQYVIDHHTVPVTTFKDPLEQKTLLGHNLLFDLPYLHKYGIFPRKVVDTMMWEWCLTQGMMPIAGRERSLDACLYRYLGIKIDKSAQKTINQGLKSVEDIIYSGTDVMHLKNLKEAMWPTVRARGVELGVSFQSQDILPLAYMEYCGITIDKEALDWWIRNCEADEMISVRKLKEYADINWGSPQQVGEVLKTFGIEHINEETGNLETNDDILSKYDLPVVTELQEFREVSKMVSTYGRKWYSYIQKDGRIHTKYKPMVDTGRTACGEVDRRRYDPWDLNYVSKKPFPNMQNPPKKRKGFRDIFIPKPGNVLIGCDFSGQESVILADQSEDPNMMALFGGEGQDPHSYVVRIAYPELAGLTDEEIKEKHSDIRDICKTAAFAIAYGGNGKTIADNINCSRELGDHIYNSYMEAFPKLKEFFAHCYDFAWRRGYMPTDWVIKGKRFFDRASDYKAWKENDKYWKRYWKANDLHIALTVLDATGHNNAESIEPAKQNEIEWFLKEKEKMKWFSQMTSSLRKESVNTRIQGTGAVMSKLAMIYFYQWILEEKLIDKVKIVIFVHDEIVAECHKRSADKVAAALQDCMERAGKKCLKHLTIKADAKITTKWEK